MRRLEQVKNYIDETLQEMRDAGEAYDFDNNKRIYAEEFRKLSRIKYQIYMQIIEGKFRAIKKESLK